MTKPFNPLLDKRRNPVNAEHNTGSIEMNASEDSEITGSAPVSPISGRPMIKAFCRDVPVWVDPSNRLVLPMKA